MRHFSGLFPRREDTEPPQTVPADPSAVTAASDDPFMSIQFHDLAVEEPPDLHSGARLSARVESSGVEVDAQQKQQMVWFVLEFAAATPVKRLSLRNVVLQEQFGDQQNIVQVMHLPDEARQTLYFAPGDAKAQEMAF